MDKTGKWVGPLDFGYCGPDCPIYPDDTMTSWNHDDKTIEMSLQYDISDLIMIMINVYSFLITGILILLLFLTILLPATG